MSFPQTQQPDDFLAVLKAAVREFDEDAVVEVCGRFVRGEVKRIPSAEGYAPSTAEFCQAVRDRVEFLEHMKRPAKVARLPAPSIRTDDLRPVQAARAASAKYAHLPVIAEQISYAQFKTGCDKRQWPEGAFWIAANGNVYYGSKTNVAG